MDHFLEDQISSDSQRGKEGSKKWGGKESRRSSTSQTKKIIVQSAYTSVIERSTIVMKGCDCNHVSMHDAMGFYYCHVTTS